MDYAIVIKRINDLVKSDTTLPHLVEENKSYTPKVPTPWMRTTMLPAEPTYISSGRNRQLRYGGLVQLDSFIRANTGSADTSVDKIVNLINNPDNRYIVVDGYAIILDYAYRNASTTNTDWYQTPIMIRWYAMPSQ